jgi:hypothetical protein
VTPRLIEGVVEPDDREERIAELEDEIRELKADLRRAQRAAQDAEAHAVAVFAPLRQQLTPFYRMLQSIFGDLDAAGVVDAPSAAGGRASAAVAVWDAWKARLPGGPAKIIDTFLAHQNREMNIQQLAMASGIHRNSIPNMMTKLNKAGLIQKNGRQFCLKAL